MNRRQPSAGGHGVRRARLVPLVVALPLALPLVLSACGAGDAARNAASDAAGSASSSVRQAATDQVLQQVCQATTGSGPLADVRLNQTERDAVGALAKLASASGVPQRYVGPLETIAASRDDQDVADAITSLRKACADRPSSSSSSAG
jgi:hypothetical protein